MTVSKKTLKAGIATLAAGAATAVFLQASEASPEKGFSLFMRGDLFPGCAVNTLMKSEERSGELYIGNRAVSVGDQSISLVGNYTFETAAQSPEAAQQLKDSLKDCLREQTFNPDVKVLRVIPSSYLAPTH